MKGILLLLALLLLVIAAELHVLNNQLAAARDGIDDYRDTVKRIEKYLIGAN
jgi:hypothetical protein